MRSLRAALLLWGGICASPGLAVPPPPERPPIVVGAPGPDGARLADEVRAYDFVSFLVEARAGEVLEVRLEDASAALAVDLESPSGTALVEGARPAADGMRVRLGESGSWSIRVAMSADAARAGRSARFVLVVRTRP